MLKKNKIKQIIKMLKFILSTDDLDIIKPTVESIIETMEEFDK